ncbi:ASCH domain-containing protein [Corynebacterium freiburgense]|uniref:ASCH domain-containing protein n=1 Tax=Corynebacterium freiburgense TaxID=556548 RepID=UPI000416608B|nr:ASCH domain-containing protein [Corynebacterium freiburgense]WJZ02588.1 ASCH domain protein [Corynebacterium freiburgense]
MPPQALPCVIYWDPQIFTAGNRSLSAALTLHTQLYCQDSAWSVVFSFKAPPVDQGIITIADEVRFLVDEAPNELLTPGFEFPFYDGGNVIGNCRIVESRTPPDADIQVLKIENDTALLTINGIETHANIGYFGFPGELRERLISAIVSGEKTATASLEDEFNNANTELPQPGDIEVVVDSTNMPVCAVEIVEAQVVPFSSVSVQHAQNEGEGFSSVEEWAEAHRAYWETQEFLEYFGDPEFRITDSTPIVCVRFVLIGSIGGNGG